MKLIKSFVFDKVILEIKTTENMADEDFTQTIIYLNCSGFEVGLKESVLIMQQSWKPSVFLQQTICWKPAAKKADVLKLPIPPVFPKA